MVIPELPAAASVARASSVLSQSCCRLPSPVLFSQASGALLPLIYVCLVVLGLPASGLPLLAVHRLLVRSTGLDARQHERSPQTKDQTRVPCIDGWILPHCATREVPF